MTWVLYDNHYSGNCYKVRLLLAQLGIACERRELSVSDRSDRPQTLGSLNPALRVPTLVFDDGRVLAESGAILFHLAEGTRYLPADGFERAQALQWMFFEQYDLEPNVAVLRFRAHEGVESEPADLATRRAGGERALSALENHLAGREWLVGADYSIADIALYGYTHVAPEGGFPLTALPAIRAWMARVAAQPGHITIDA